MPDKRVIVCRETELGAPAERVWNAILRPSTMLYLLRGWFSVPSPHSRIDPITEGEAGTGWTPFFHVIPFAKWTIHIVRVDPATRTIVTNEHGGIIRCWNHTLHVEALGANRSRYIDRIEVGAGALTSLVATSARLVLSYRQHRLRGLARAHLAGGGTAGI